MGRRGRPGHLGEAIRRPDRGLDQGQVLALAALRAFLLIGGDSADGDRSWPYIAEAIPPWRLTGAGAGGSLDHRRGHAYPPEVRSCAERWLDRFVGPDAG
jgi:hypothetical protein